MTKEAEDVEVPVFDLTLIKDQDSGYSTLVKTICTKLFRVQSDILSSYWETGEMLHKFVNDQIELDDKRNVSEILRKLSEDVHAVSGGRLEYSDSTLRKMLLFRESVSDDQLDRLKKLGVPISKVLPMCIGDVKDDDRDVIIEELESGTVGTAQIPDRVKELCPVEDREETRGGVGPFQTIKNLNTTMDKMCTLVEGDLTMHAATVMASDDDEAKVNFTRQLRLAKNRMATLQRVHDVICSAYLVGDFAVDE